MWASLAEADGWSRVLAVDTRKFQTDFRYRRDILGRVRGFGADICISPAFSRNLATSDSIVLASKARIKIGSMGDSHNTPGVLNLVSKAIYDDLKVFGENEFSEHRRNSLFLLAICPDLGVTPAPKLQWSQGSSRFEAGEAYFVLFPGAGWGGRRWPLENFVELAKRVQAKYGLRPVVCGGPDEVELAARFAQAVPGARDQSGDAPIGQLCEILAKASVVITNETSAAHLAEALAVPSVCILGGGHYGRFLPRPESDRTEPERQVCVSHQMDCFGCNWRCTQPRSPKGPMPCISAIAVDDVWGAVKALLGSGNRRADYSVASGV